MRRKMPEHELPTYAAVNYRTLQFILTRAPKGKDFPREWIYRPQSIDLLFRHFYKGPHL